MGHEANASEADQQHCQVEGSWTGPATPSFTIKVSNSKGSEGTAFCSFIDNKAAGASQTRKD
jgi:hypothetical protein